MRIDQGPERPWQATFVRWKRRRVSRFLLQLPNPHEPRQCGLSHVDGRFDAEDHDACETLVWPR